MKPHIKPFGFAGLWCCQGIGFVFGVGASPRLAYEAWQRRLRMTWPCESNSPVRGVITMSACEQRNAKRAESGTSQSSPCRWCAPQSARWNTQPRHGRQRRTKSTRPERSRLKRGLSGCGRRRQHSTRTSASATRISRVSAAAGITQANTTLGTISA